MGSKMNIKKFGNFLSIGAIILAILHIIYPHLGIDITTISLLIIAVLPQIIHIIKTIELPGGIKIYFKEVKEEVNRELEIQGNLRAESSDSGNFILKRNRIRKRKEIAVFIAFISGLIVFLLPRLIGEGIMGNYITILFTSITIMAIFIAYSFQLKIER